MDRFQFSRRGAMALMAGSLWVSRSPGQTVEGASAGSASGLGWNQWRGSSRTGLLSESLPNDLSGLQKSWSRELGDSYSGPIVEGQSVVVTESVNQSHETAVALDVASGREIWKQRWEGAMAVPFFAKANGDWIRSTPAIGGGRVVVCGMRDTIATFDLTDGSPQWSIDFVADHGAALPSFGLVCSPLIDGGDVFVQAGGGLRRIDLGTGELKWKALPDDGGMYGGAFSSPILAEIGGVKQIIVQTREALAGVDKDSGSVLWQVPIASFRGMNILTPTVWKDSVFTSCYGGRSQLIRVSQSANGWSADKVWEGKSEAYMSSPILVGDHAYCHLKNNRVSCIDLNSGQEAWRTTPFGKYWSMVSDGSKILSLDQRGELILFAASPESFQILDRKTVSEQECWAHLAVADGKIFVRRQRGLDVWHTS